MATLVSGNRSDLKKCFNKMLHQVSLNDLDEVGLSLDLFEGHVLKYCIARGQDFKVFHEKAKRIRHSLTHFRTPWRRTERLFEQMQDLHKLFVESEKGMSLQSRLKMISEDLTYDISLLFEAESDFDPSSIFDSFDSLSELAVEIRKEGYEVYQIFRQLIRNVGVSKPYIPSKISATDKPRPQDIKQLKQVMGPVFSVWNDLIAKFDEPPAPKKKKSEEKKDKDYSVLDIDEVKREALTHEALHYIFKENWPPQSTARHLNMTIEDLLDLLGVELEGEGEEEEKKVVQDADGEKDKNIQTDE